MYLAVEKDGGPGQHGQEGQSKKRNKETINMFKYHNHCLNSDLFPSFTGACSEEAMSTSGRADDGRRLECAHCQFKGQRRDVEQHVLDCHTEQGAP